MNLKLCDRLAAIILTILLISSFPLVVVNAQDGIMPLYAKVDGNMLILGFDEPLYTASYFLGDFNLQAYNPDTGYRSLSLKNGSAQFDMTEQHEISFKLYPYQAIENDIITLCYDRGSCLNNYLDDDQDGIIDNETEQTIIQFYEAEMINTFSIPVINNTSYRISDELLPEGLSEAPYSHCIQVIGVLSPYTVSITSGSLPDGFCMDQNGMISGTTNQAGSFSFTVTVIDALSRSISKEFNLTILSPYTIGDMFFTDLFDNPVTLLENDCFAIANVSVVKNDSSNTPAILILGLFNDNVLKDISFMRIHLNQHESITFGAGFMLRQDYQIKAFIWNNMQQMKTMSNNIIYPF